MFNRTLQVGLVKKTPSQNGSVEEAEVDLEAKVTIVTRAIEHGIRRIGLVVCAYVVLDTARKVIVEASKK